MGLGIAQIRVGRDGYEGRIEVVEEQNPRQQASDAKAAAHQRERAVGGVEVGGFTPMGDEHRAADDGAAERGVTELREPLVVHREHDTKHLCPTE